MAAWTAAEAAALGFLGLVLTVVAFVCWYRGVAGPGIERAGLFVGLVPVFALATVSLADATVPAPPEWPASCWWRRV